MIAIVKNKFRYRVHQILEAGAHDDLPSRICDGFIITMIVLNVLAFVFGSIDWVAADYGPLLNGFEIFSILFFTVEYVLRIWASVEHAPLRGLSPFKARLHFAMQPLLLIDLIAVAPFYLGALVGLDLRFLRVMRLFRFLKILRYSPAMQVIVKVFYNEGRALLAALMIMLALILFAATGMHYLEGHVQPETFGDIPSSMWWALATLTTVGFGDAVPVTPLGKLWSGLFMIFGLGMFALPIGIVSTGFAQELNRREFVINWNMVARVPLFNKLEAVEVAEIMKLLHSKRFPREMVIYKRGETALGMYFIVSGNVALHGPQQNLNLCSGDFFGEDGLLHEGRYGGTARTMSDCHLLFLDRHDFEYLLTKNEGLHRHVSDVSSERMKPREATEEAEKN